MALIASFFSIKVGISVALIRRYRGRHRPATSRNSPARPNRRATHACSTGSGSVLLTFSPGRDRSRVRSRNIGRPVSPWAWCRSFCPHWCVLLRPDTGFIGNFHASEIAGIALSTTSVAVVYAVMVETGLNRQDIGKLSSPRASSRTWVRFWLWRTLASYDWLLLVFVLVTACPFFLPKILRWVVANVGHRVSEPR